MMIGAKFCSDCHQFLVSVDWVSLHGNCASHSLQFQIATKHSNWYWWHVYCKLLLTWLKSLPLMFTEDKLKPEQNSTNTQHAVTKHSRRYVYYSSVQWNIVNVLQDICSYRHATFLIWVQYIFILNFFKQAMIYSQNWLILGFGGPDQPAVKKNYIYMTW